VWWNLQSTFTTSRWDSEVREILGVGIRMYQEYMQRIHEEDKLAWNEIVKDQLESEALAVRDCMLYCCKYAKEQLENKDTPSSDRIEWINTLQGTRTNMLKLLVEGAEYLKTAKQVYPPRIPQIEERVEQTKEMQQSHDNIMKRLRKKKE
jgi:urease accessory protein UreF